MISEVFSKKIIGLLQGNIVNENDFDLIQKENSGYQLLIVYKYDHEIIFKINISYTGVPSSVSFSPGNILASEEKRIGKDDSVEDYVRQWIGNIGLKMSALPVIRKIFEQDEKINQIKEMMKSYTDNSNFNSKEIDELNTKLNELQERFEEKIKSDMEMSDDQENVIEEMKKDIARLKAEANILTKKNWALSFCTKMYMITQKHPKVTAFIGGLAYQSLPESIKVNIPESSIKMLANTESGEGREE